VARGGAIKELSGYLSLLLEPEWLLRVIFASGLNASKVVRRRHGKPKK
jgi:hypothetical protein